MHFIYEVLNDELIIRKWKYPKKKGHNWFLVLKIIKNDEKDSNFCFKNILKLYLK